MYMYMVYIHVLVNTQPSDQTCCEISFLQVAPIFCVALYALEIIRVADPDPGVLVGSVSSFRIRVYLKGRVRIFLDGRIQIQFFTQSRIRIQLFPRRSNPSKIHPLRLNVTHQNWREGVSVCLSVGQSLTLRVLTQYKRFVTYFYTFYLNNKGSCTKFIFSGPTTPLSFVLILN